LPGDCELEECRSVRLLLRCNDQVLLSFVESLMREARIGAAVADQSMSVLEGSLAILPRRVLVPDDDWHRAAQILEEAGLAQWVVRDESTG